MSKIPACFVCASTPAELRLFGKPYCEKCAHESVTQAVTRAANRTRARRPAELPPVVVRDGVEGLAIGDQFLPFLF